MSYRAYLQHTRETVALAQPWRLVLGLFLAIGVMMVVLTVSSMLLAALMPPIQFEDFIDTIGEGVSIQGDLLLLYMLGAMGVGAVCSALILHRRGIGSLIGPLQLAVPQFARVLIYVFALYAVLALVSMLSIDEMLLPGVPLSTWLPILPLITLGLIIQTGSEEIMFRGYLQSQLAAKFDHPLIWIGGPSLLFGLVHYAPEIFGGNAWLVVIWALIYGVATADITARAKTLGPAMAMHFANNFMAIAIVSPNGDLSALALYQLPFGPDDVAKFRQYLPQDLLGILLTWLAARIAIRA